MKYARSIRAKIVYICLLFTFLISITVGISFLAINRKQLLNEIMASKAYNMNLLTSLINSDMVNIDTLAKWCSINTEVKDVLDEEDGALWLDCYYSLQPTIVNNPSFNVIDRIIIMNKDISKFIQFLPRSAGSRALSHENVYYELPLHSENFSNISLSALSYPYPKVIKKLLPIIDYNANNETIGYVYVAINVEELLKNVFSYAANNESTLSIKLDTLVYRLIDGGLVLTESKANESKELPTSFESNEETKVYFTDIEDNPHYSVVTATKDYSLQLIETIKNPKPFVISTPYIYTLFVLLIAFIIFAAILIITLNQLIYAPVKKLSTKLRNTAKGDFSIDTTLETKDEFGEIGLRINKLNENVTYLMEEKVEDERKKQELEYRILLNQINPHFMYNTFNSIKWMAQIQQATGISEIVTSLARLMKAISKGKSTMIALQEEINLAHEYMTIMRYRYGNTIIYKEEVAEDALNANIPRFILQPILENSIFHGIESKGSGTIELKVYKQNGNIIIQIEDDGIGFDCKKTTQSKDSGMFIQIGLDNIRGRLEYAFQDKASLTVDSTINVGTTVTITIPEKTDEL